MYRRVRFSVSVSVASTPSSRRVRFDVSAPVSYTPPSRRVRLQVTVPVSPRRTYRVRFEVSSIVIKDTITDWFYQKEDILEQVLRSGKGSILNEDLEFVQISDSGIHINPGFFYYGYKEYYAFPENRSVYPLGTGIAIDVPKTTIQINQNYPFYVLDSEPTTRFIPTNNPADSGEGYRKISNLAPFVDSLDGLTAYSFEQNEREYTVEDTGDNYEFEFHTNDTGNKYLIYVPDTNLMNSTDEVIVVALPNPYECPELLNKFLCITDDKIIIAPDAITVYYPHKQYASGDNVPVMVTVRGTRGEFAPNYPVTINDANYITDDNGKIETLISSNVGYIFAKTTTGATLPATYSDSCTDSRYFTLIEKVRDQYGETL